MNDLKKNLAEKGKLVHFKLYINDLIKNLTESCKVVQYADDTLLFCDDNDIKNALQLLQNPVRICLCTSQNIL